MKPERKNLLPEAFGKLNFVAHVIGLGLAHGFVLIALHDREECSECGKRHFDAYQYRSTQPAEFWNYEVRWNAIG